ncbi:MAG: ATP-dependent helicase HrpB [Pseudomonadota bacterium]
MADDLPPVSEVADDVTNALARHRRAVLVAPPGAGKTTYIPLHLLRSREPGQIGKILLLSPRRLAARAAADRMAKMLGEKPGQTVGYRVRLETRVSAQTRIEVVTEGILQRMIFDDPELTGIETIIFDEFHERSLDADFGLALALDVADALRDDLSILVMSATIDGAAVSKMLGEGIPVIHSEGRMFPVDIQYRPKPGSRRLEDEMASAVLDLVREERGSILAFLPGQAEIKRTAQTLESKLPAEIALHQLYGAAGIEAQSAAVAATGENERKIVLATSIAETSITIHGARHVVDSGLSREPRYDPETGITRLETVRASKASITQRAGRAGRTAPGTATRLWAAAANNALPDYAIPELQNADLSRLVLDCAAFGVGDPTTLRFPDALPERALAKARDLLQALDLLEPDGRPTAKGVEAQKLPFAIRDAAMVQAVERDTDPRVFRAALALLKSEQGLGGIGNDIAKRFRNLRADRSKRAGAVCKLAERIGGARPDWASSFFDAAEALLDGYTDRIAKRRDAGSGRYILANGLGAYLDADDPLASSEWLVVTDVTGSGPDKRILAAAALSDAQVLGHSAVEIIERTALSFDKASRSVRAREQKMLGAIRLSSQPTKVEPNEDVQRALTEGVRRHGLSILQMSKATIALRARLHWLHQNAPEIYPQFDEATLRDDVNDWLLPFLAGITSFDELEARSLDAALLARGGLQSTAQLNSIAPGKITVSNGSELPLNYPEDGGSPIICARPQMLYGTKQHPSILDGKVPVLIEMLSPAQRPIQRTSDLPGFWKGGWSDLRRDMRSQYPKHDWPEDPANAQPNRRRGK